MAVPIVLALTTAALGASYDEQRLAAVAACEANDLRDYQSGLLFNPDGYRSLLRSLRVLPAGGAGVPRRLALRAGAAAGRHAAAHVASLVRHASRRSQQRPALRPLRGHPGAWPEFSYGTRYTVPATLTLDAGPGNLGGRWSDTFVEGVFPRAERSQALEKDIGF
jgi:hypothetical protein